MKFEVSLLSLEECGESERRPPPSGQMWLYSMVMDDAGAGPASKPFTGKWCTMVKPSPECSATN